MKDFNKIYYGVRRDVFKNNKVMPEETIIEKPIFKTLEEAVRYMKHEQDSNSLRYGYRYVSEGVAVQESPNYKTGKVTVYRHEWSLVKFELQEEEK